MYRFLALALTMMCATELSADTAPSFDCAKAVGSVETLICSDEALAGLDQRLAMRFKEALSAIRALQSGAKEAEAELRAYQRGWIGGRNDCYKASDQRACVEAAYLIRENELVTQWMLVPPVATEFWTCSGSPANELVVMRFDTELPSLRLEYGDSIASASQTPVASGVRYEADFGRAFWMKGDDATLTWPEGTEQSCKRRS
ncbi:MAG: MliC family protein [Arenibacterium sp.]